MSLSRTIAAALSYFVPFFLNFVAYGLRCKRVNTTDLLQCKRSKIEPLLADCRFQIMEVLLELVESFLDILRNNLPLWFTIRQPCKAKESFVRKIRVFSRVLVTKTKRDQKNAFPGDKDDTAISASKISVKFVT